MLTIKEMVSNNKQVYFEFYQNGNLWYKTENGFEFPVPIEDTGDAAFLAQDKAMFFMRYIRKQMDKNIVIDEMADIKVDNGSKMAQFMFYRKNEMWYITEDGFEFPVLVTENVQFTLSVHEDLFTTYIDAQRELIKNAQNEQKG